MNGRVKTNVVLFILFLIPVLLGCYEEEPPELTGNYFSQTPPDTIPSVFAPDIISHGFHEHSLTFSPEYNELFYVTADHSYSLYRIITMKRVNDNWSKQMLAPFSSDYSDMSPAFSPDGSRLFFGGKRPTPENITDEINHDLWYVDKVGDKWSEPVSMGSPVNTASHEANPSVSSDGTLYFQRNTGSANGWDIYYSEFIDGEYSEPVQLLAPINTPHNESAPFISPDEEYLLFHSNRPGGEGINDIYACFRREDGEWGEPVNLGREINSPASEFKPSVSPDGKYLFYSSYKNLSSDKYLTGDYDELLNLYRNPQNGTGTIFWVDASVIHKLKEQ
jgi:Tol biopolymer transport system component